MNIKHNIMNIFKKYRAKFAIIHQINKCESHGD